MWLTEDRLFCARLKPWLKNTEALVFYILKSKGVKIVKVSEICKIVNDCDRLRDILRKDEHKLTDSEINEICDLLWDYRAELLKKEVQ